MNNYDDVFPTGQVEPVQETAYDFLAPEGRSLGKLSLDDCFVDLIRPTSGQASALIIDPAAQYGVRVTALSPEIQAIQIAAPVNSAFIALEPQFHWTDPFSVIWGKDAPFPAPTFPKTEFVCEIECFKKSGTGLRVERTFRKLAGLG